LLETHHHMVTNRGTSHSRRSKIRAVENIIRGHVRAGLRPETARAPSSSEWVVDGEQLRNFGTCSYLSLERRPELIAGAKAALDEMGTNFSISRIYAQCPLYEALEASLSEITEAHVVVTASTTLAHLAALPVLIDGSDVVIVDRFAHASVHMATELIKDVPVESLSHSRMDLLEQQLRDCDPGVTRVWYLCDGVYSMLGDLAPFAELSELLTRYPKLHLYIDDAHGFSWTGRHGRGVALEALDGAGELDALGALTAHRERVVVAVSLSKSFGAMGGALALPTSTLKERVRLCGGPMIFSGPLAPAVLGSAVASAKLHQSTQFVDLRAELHERIAFAHRIIEDAGIELATEARTPIFMVHFASVRSAQDAVLHLRKRGFYVCLSTFPAVPIDKPSIRFTVSRHNSFADIRALVEALGEVCAVSSRREEC
jgi:7-keto-8-aminopelargonate synthetase-like enzyme